MAEQRRVLFVKSVYLHMDLDVFFQISLQGHTGIYSVNTYCYYLCILHLFLEELSVLFL